MDKMDFNEHSTARNGFAIDIRDFIKAVLSAPIALGLGHANLGQLQ
ncbi:MAG TPA: hypothetical protein VK503_11330 [Candidatus Bathyarchaeia archaeon]|nr:hypothetical protein [Candidatus Bathyarchaeia archaeon]